MRESPPRKFAGIYPALTTPFAADGSLALDRLRANLATYNRTRLRGYLVTGSTGESVLLSDDETERVWATAREAAAPEKILIAGTGTESTAETIERTSRAATLGYAAALVNTPHYFKPQMSAEALAGHFLRVADAAPIPILLYSVPQFTGIALEAPLVARLAEHPNIAGMKDSSGNVARIGEILAAVPPAFQLLVGSSSTLYPSLVLGAVGGILALACALPEECIELYETVRAGDSGRALALQQRLLAPSKTLVSHFGISGLKYALDRLGYYGGPTRPPLPPVDKAARREIDAVLATTSVGAAVRN